MGIKEPANVAILSFISGMAMLPVGGGYFVRGKAAGHCKDMNRYVSNYINQVGTFVP